MTAKKFPDAHTRDYTIKYIFDQRLPVAKANANRWSIHSRV